MLLTGQSTRAPAPTKRPKESGKASTCGTIQSTNLTCPFQSMVFSGTNRRTRRPLQPRFERAIRIDGGQGGSRQTIKPDSDSLIGPVVEINGLINALGTRHRSAALQTIGVSRTRQRDKRSHRRAGNKTPERCRSRDPKRCRIRDRSQANGHQTEPAARPGAFHLRSSAKSADKSSPISVSLTMIVRDEENNISKYLSSVAGLFDEIVVVDTGSQGRTREIAREFGACVFDLVLVDDFAAARNAALARATGDYAFWLDADDVVDPPSGRSCGSCWTGCRAAGEEAEALRWASRGRSTHPTSRAG